MSLYHPWVYLRSGVERWMVELITRSRHDWTVYTHHYEPDATYPEVSGLRVVQLQPEVSVRRSLGPLVHAAGTLLRTRLPLDGTSALLVSSEGLGDLIALRSKVPVAAYCHTPLKILHDPSAASVVRTSPARRLALGTIGPAFEAVDRRAWRHYSHVLANSTETVARIQAARLRPSGPLEVLTPGVSASWWEGPIAHDRAPVLLYAGRIMWQKNIELAIDTVRLLGSSARLVIAGMVDEKSAGYLEELRALAVGLPVTFESAPSDQRLRELYGQATALLFTPRNEDFGMVVLEAMAAGTPVLSVDAGGPRGIVEHGVDGWLLPPTPEAFAGQVEQLLAMDLRPHREAARKTAQACGWDAHVARIDDVMEGLGSGQQRGELGRRV
ncbi:MAG: glycosyl transferase group 1 [Frankiales bacterium]|nr:glycosyl transferase group 1 [Frankiales bacterium]